MRSPPGRTAGAFRPPIAAFSARRASAAWSAISSRPAITVFRVPARDQVQPGLVGVGLDLVEVLGQLRDQGGVRRIGGLVAGVRRGVLVVRGVVVGRVAARLGLGVRLVRDGVLVVGFGTGVVRLGLRRLLGRRGGVDGLGGAVVPGNVGRLVLGGRVRAAGGVVAGSAGLPSAGPAASGAGPARVQVSGMPGRRP